VALPLANVLRPLLGPVPELPHINLAIDKVLLDLGLVQMQIPPALTADVKKCMGSGPEPLWQALFVEIASLLQIFNGTYWKWQSELGPRIIICDGAIIMATWLV
jgi:hypothetical protein